MNGLRNLKEPQLQNQLRNPKQPQEPRFSAQQQPQPAVRYYDEGDMAQWQPANPQQYAPQSAIQVTNPDFSGSDFNGMNQMQDAIGMFGQQPPPFPLQQPDNGMAQIMPIGGVQPIGQNELTSLQDNPMRNSMNQSVGEFGQNKDLRQQYLSKLFSDFEARRNNRRRQSPIPNGAFEQGKDQLQLDRRGWGQSSVPPVQMPLPKIDGMGQMPPVQMPSPNLGGLGRNVPPVQMPTPNYGMGQQIQPAQSPTPNYGMGRQVPPSQMPLLGGMGNLGGTAGSFGGMGMFGGQNPMPIQPTLPTQPLTPAAPVGSAPAEYTDLQAKYENMIKQLMALQGNNQQQRLF